MPERAVHEQIKELTAHLLALYSKVVQNFSNALWALTHLDGQNIRLIRNTGREVDMAEVELEAQCLSFLALQQPVAKDLRTIVTIMKINNALERIGDLSVHIIDRMPEIRFGMLDFEIMGSKVNEMLDKSMQAFLLKDRVLADLVCSLDEEIDSMHRVIFKKVVLLMKDQGSDTDQLIAVMSVSRYLERIADHATKIAREVIYLVTGEIVRHTERSYTRLL